jgi:hypothetical protein
VDSGGTAIPVPVSARWASRASNLHRKSRFSIASGGMPRSWRVWSRIRLTVGSAMSPARTGFGMAFVMFWSMRMANWGACAALANSFSALPTFIGSGFTRWKVSPGSSSSGR